MQCNIRAQLGLVVDGGPGELRGCGRERGSHLGGRDPMPLNVQGQLTCVDQRTCIQLMYEAAQRPGRQIARTELGEQVMESFCVPEGFLNWMALESQQTKSLESVSRARLLRGVAGSCSPSVLQREHRNYHCSRSLWECTPNIPNCDGQFITMHIYTHSLDPGHKCLNLCTCTDRDLDPERLSSHVHSLDALEKIHLSLARTHEHESVCHGSRARYPTASGANS